MSKIVGNILKKRASIWSAGAVGLPTALATYLIAKKLGANAYLAGGLGLGVGAGAGFGAHKLSEYLKAGDKPPMPVERFKEEVEDKGDKRTDESLLDQVNKKVAQDKAKQLERIEAAIATGHPNALFAAIKANRGPSVFDSVPKPERKPAVFDHIGFGNPVEP